MDNNHGSTQWRYGTNTHMVQLDKYYRFRHIVKDYLEPVGHKMI